MRTRAKGRSAGLSEESAGEASNLMRRPVQWRSRNTTTSACVGWDLTNIENRLTFRKQARRSLLTAGPRQNGLTTTRITIPIMRIVGTSLIKR
jgi:hypothetical protein